VLHLAQARTAQAHHVVIASGARYRRPLIENLDKFESAGVSYWASPIEADLCEGKEVALVGAGNSAGQAIAYLAPKVERLHLFVRGESLEASLSGYLVDRISALPNITLYLRMEVIALAADAVNGLRMLTFRNRDSGESGSLKLNYLFLFIGADPNTDWLEGSDVAQDENGLVLTADAAARPCWSEVQRPSLPLETSVPNIFAIGDVRASSTKRVAAAVGEGAQVVATLHNLLPLP
jgi:thioredoxin reductase (NADPH)